MSLSKILQVLAQKNRSAYQYRQLDAQKKSDRAQEHLVEVVAFNATTGLYQLQDMAGNLILARSITNGIIGMGDYVSLVRPSGGVPVIDGMPK